MSTASPINSDTDHVTNGELLELTESQTLAKSKICCSMDKFLPRAIPISIFFAYAGVTANLMVHIATENQAAQVLASVIKCTTLIAAGALAGIDLRPAIRNKSGEYILVDLEAIVGNGSAIAGNVLNIFQNSLGSELKKLGFILEVGIPTFLFTTLTVQGLRDSARKVDKLGVVLDGGQSLGMATSLIASLLGDLESSSWGLFLATLCAGFTALRPNLPESCSAHNLYSKFCLWRRGGSLVSLEPINHSNSLALEDGSVSNHVSGKAPVPVQNDGSGILSKMKECLLGCCSSEKPIRLPVPSSKYEDANSLLPISYDPLQL